jgi:hypothetical protein
MRSKYLMSAAFSALFGLLIAFSANAQHRGGGGSRGGGGGGFRGGSSFHGSTGGSFHGSTGGGGFHGNTGGGSSRGNTGGSFHGNTGGSRATISRPGTSYRGSSSVGRSNPSTAFHGNARTYSNGRIATAPRANSITRSYGGRAPVTAYRGGSAYRGGNVYRGGISRGGVYRGGVYRGRVGLYGRGYNRFYTRNAFYNRYYLPRLGFHISVLPYGYYPFYWGNYQYFYSDGYYYQHDDDNYTIVEPPLGAILNQLPAGATSIMIDGEQYYELNGVYYQAVTQDDGSTGYQIAGKDGELSTGASDNANVEQDNGAAPVVGDIVDVLPPDCNTVKINGQKYFVSPDGYYYQQDYDSNNRLVYRVTGTPTDEPSN